MAEEKFIKISKSFFVDADFELPFRKLGMTSIEAVFSFHTAKNLAKKNLASFRSRLQFEIHLPDSSEPMTLFMKRYDSPPIFIQMKNWLTAHCRKSCSSIELETAQKLTEAGIHTPKTVAYGTQWGTIFEKRSFIITQKIPNAEALERELPAYFQDRLPVENLRRRRDFIAQLARFIKRFHETDYRHRDLYFSHIFYDDAGRFFLIDLARAFKPAVLKRRYRVKDLAQVYYSAPGRYFSKTDRLRFYFGYIGRHRLNREDKAIIRRIIRKAKQMARHDIRHGRNVPFTS